MIFTAIQGRVLRTIGLDTFADITTAPLVLPGGIDRQGLLFAGDLTPEQVEAIWWRMTSRDDLDQQRRDSLGAAMTGGASNLAAMLAAYQLDLPMPAPVYPPPA